MCPFFKLPDIEWICYRIREQSVTLGASAPFTCCSVCFRCPRVGASNVVTLTFGEMNQWLQACCDNKGPFLQKSSVQGLTDSVF